MLKRVLSLVGVLLLSIPATVFAQAAFAPIPADQTGGKPSGLEIRVVQYNGSVNGELGVEIRNPTKQPVEFSARGLYFVPSGNPDQAPQRVGAVGPFQMKTANGWERRAKMTVAAGATAQLKVDVYCIDSHRGSPSSSTSFRVGNSRVPAPMVEAIDRDAARAAEAQGGVSSPAAKPSVQSQVWKNRDEHWVPLDGEGRQEAAKKK